MGLIRAISGGMGMRGFAKAVQSGTKSLLQVFLGLIAGLCIYVMSATLTGDQWGWNWLIAIFLAPVFTLPAVLIHEAGHAAGALRSGWIVERFVVWPLAYSPRTRSWSFVSRPVGRGEIGGWVVTHPRPGRGSTREEVLVLVGGVVANVASAIVCLVVSGFFASSSADTLLKAFAVFSIVLAVTNLIPWRIAGQASDGLQLLRLRRRKHRKAESKKTKSQWDVPRKW